MKPTYEEIKKMNLKELNMVVAEYLLGYKWFHRPGDLNNRLFDDSDKSVLIDIGFVEGKNPMVKEDLCCKLLVRRFDDICFLIENELPEILAWQSGYSHPSTNIGVRDDVAENQKYFFGTRSSDMFCAETPLLAAARWLAWRAVDR